MGAGKWAETELINVVRYKKGKKPKVLERDNFDGLVPYINIEAFETGRIHQYADRKSSNICFEKDVLVVWDGARFGLTGTNQMGAVGSTLMCLTPILIESTYLLKFIQSKYQEIQQNPKGTGIPHVNPDVLWNFIIPIAPLAEQQRIVEKLDAILPRVKAVKARLDKIPAILKRFRQSVLAAACSGKLTEDWREENPDLVSCIDAKEIEVHSFSVPDSWKVIELKEIAEIKGGITKDSNKQKLTDCEVPYLRVANVQRGYLDLREMKTIRIPQEKLDDFLLKTGDILLNEGGDIDKLGRGWIWEAQIEPCSHQNHVFRARLKDPRNEPKYISWWAITVGSDFFFQSGKQTTGIASINKTKLSCLPILIPGYDEQHEIVSQVQALFKLADSLEAKYKAAMKHINKIEQALLAKAFRGELAAQDPDDEPAEVLLKRILREKGMKLTK
jgi:type I restriction enzyme S subunit